MSEEQDVFGEDQDSSTETEQEETTEEEVEESSDTVPYERFAEVNNKFRETEVELEMARQQLAEREEEVEEEKPEFETPEDLIEFQDKKVEEKLNTSLESRDAMWEAKLEAQDKIHQLKEEFPEAIEDPMFADFVSAKISNNPDMDVIEAAQQVKDHLESLKSEGKKEAEEKLAIRGTLGGGVAGRPPQTDADKEYAQSIVSAGQNDSIF